MKTKLENVLNSQEDLEVLREIPSGVRGVALLYFISFGFFTLISIGLLISSLNDTGNIMFSMLLFGCGAFNLLLGLELRHGRNWARIVILIFQWMSAILGITTIIAPIISGIIIYTLQFEKKNVAYFAKEPYHEESLANRKLKDEVERLKYHAEKLKIEKEIEKIKKGKV